MPKPDEPPGQENKPPKPGKNKGPQIEAPDKHEVKAEPDATKRK